MRVARLDRGRITYSRARSRHRARAELSASMLEWWCFVSLYSDLVEWAEGRPWWQQRALAGLAAGEKITAEDCESIASVILQPAPPPQSRGWLAGLQQPVRASADQVQLVGVREVKNVNRLKPGEELTFGPNSITVVFGYNGSGKSGYARLIKQLVRTRHQEMILQDIFLESNDGPSGILDYTVGGEPDEADLAGAAPLVLGRVAFYDEKCGDAYITTEAEVTYRPSALTLLDDLYAVCVRVRGALDDLLAENARAARSLPSVAAGSPAEAFIGGLSSGTTDELIEDACAAAQDAEAELERLRGSEARLRSTDPERERLRLNGLASALESVSQHVAHLVSSLGDDRHTNLGVLRNMARETRAASELASATSFEAEPVEGVGTGTWRALWEAARRFSECQAYPDQAHPHTGAGAHCVLCQQPLSEQAGKRLRSFQLFMTDDTERQAQQAEKDLQDAIRQAASTQVETGAVAVALSSFEERSQSLKEGVEAALTVFLARRDVLSKTHLDEEALPETPETGPLIAALDERARALRVDAQSIDAGDFSQRIDALAREQRDLSAQMVLAGASSMVVAERDRLREKNRIEEARRQTNTKGLTEKVSELTRRYVTVAVQDQFSRESDRLKVERVTLQDKKGRQGSLLHKPDFIGAAVAAELPRVLSEGEQTALGLAGFFTEAHFDTSRSALVLDDPVTSLDHERRGRVAQRLVELAKERQVIVFTHDSAFAADIRRAAGEENVEFTTRSIERGHHDQLPGICRDDHPWSVKDAQKRLGWLKNDLIRIKKQAADWDSETYDREVAMWAGGLSETWERFISQDIADSLVNRGTLEVQVTMMKVVAQVTRDDNKVFQESYKRCSRWARRHDKDVALNYVAPPIDDLEQEIARVEEWFARVRKYKNVTI